MRIKKCLTLLICIFTFLHIEILFADPASHKEYFKALKEIQKIPANATPILECSLTEEKNVIKLLNTKDLESIFGGKPKMRNMVSMSKFTKGILATAEILNIYWWPKMAEVWQPIPLWVFINYQKGISLICILIML
jgi:hypothetical protein